MNPETINFHVNCPNVVTQPLMAAVMSFAQLQRAPIVVIAAHRIPRLARLARVIMDVIVLT